MGAAAFIIAEYVNVPYVEVIKAAAIPALPLMPHLFYITHIEASKLGLKGMPRNELPPFFKTLLGGAHYLFPLCSASYELIVVRHSPELAAFNAIWVMAIIMFFQNPIKAYLKKEPSGRPSNRVLPIFFQPWLPAAATWFPSPWPPRPPASSSVLWPWDWGS